MTPQIYAGIPERDKTYFLSKPRRLGRLTDLDVKYLYGIALNITGCEYRDINTNLRLRSVIETKRLVMYYLREYRKMTLHSIANYFDCDHSTVYVHCSNMKNFLSIKDKRSVQTNMLFKSEADSFLIS
jgi:chromosomal replication initiation ATPase DnaA